MCLLYAVLKVALYTHGLFQFSIEDNKTYTYQINIKMIIVMLQVFFYECFKKISCFCKMNFKNLTINKLKEFFVK